MGDALTFLVNGERVDLTDHPPHTTLLDYLRYERRLTGAKEGCAEGDCGACTVAIRDIDNAGNLRVRAVNACIQLLPMLHGKEVVTVEHLSRDGDLHPVQRALSECHGSQCGFCTPGFVMSLWAGFETAAPTDPETVADHLAGNLCRCTGYGPILDAAAKARETLAPTDSYDALARLAALQVESLDYHTETGRAWAPRSSDQLANILAEHPDSTILAGATDIGLWVTKQGFRAEKLIYIGDVADLAEVEITETGISIPAAVRHDDAMEALAKLYPDMGELWRRFASRQVRAAGTLCGNIANGSPIGDAPPALIAAGAEVTLRSTAGRRILALEDFFIAYGEQDLRPGEFVEAVDIPGPSDPAALRCYKISKRFDQDITAVLAAVNIAVEDGVATSARIAFGGMAATPKRAAAAEAALVGQPFGETSVAEAIKALDEDFQPIDDMRASAEYRMAVAKNLLLKYFLERSFGDIRVTGRGKAMAAE